MFGIAVLGLLGWAAMGLAPHNESRLLQLIQTTTVPGVKGDFDHFAVNEKGNRLFLTAEEHHSVEVFELSTGKFLRSVGGFDTPHSILYVPASNRLFVIDGGAGACKIVDGDTYAVLDTIKIAPEADSIAYDPAAQILYVTAGGEDAKMDYTIISVISVPDKKRVGEIRVDSTNIEGMVLERHGPRLFVNIRDKHLVGVIDREKRTLIATWPLPDVQGNTPIALDEPHHRLLIAGRKPGKFVVLDSNTGTIVSSLPCGDGADDLTFDPAHKRIYITGAAGLVNVYEQRDPDHYVEIGEMRTGPRGKNSVLVKGLNQFYVAVSQNGQQTAEVLVYKVLYQ